MHIYYPAGHIRHCPVSEIENGRAIPHEEVPARAEHIKSALVAAGRTIEDVSLTVPSTILSRVHTSAYLHTLEKIAASASEVQIPSIFPYGGNTKSNHLRAQFGANSFDTYTPILKGTFAAAIESASCAYAGACSLVQGNQYAYAICRPPGHHAGHAYMGGYCYINNAGVAAEYLSRRGRVAIVDVDFHHGNGTQDIFYGRSDVVFTSLHADPAWKFPYFTGNAHERGVGKGKGYTRNFPLPKGTGDRVYDATLAHALKYVAAFHPNFLVVSLGFDTHADDPIGGFTLTTTYYQHMAKRFMDLGLPTIFVQEGGYNTAALGYNVASFFSAVPV